MRFALSGRRWPDDGNKKISRKDAKGYELGAEILLEKAPSVRVARLRGVHRCDPTLIRIWRLSLQSLYQPFGVSTDPERAPQPVSFLPHFLTFASLREILFLFVFPCVAPAILANCAG
jgi:hypothetical protein